MPRRGTRCSGCQEFSPEKMAVFYWNWTWSTGDRRAYKQWFDFECSTPNLRRIVRSQELEDDCVKCGKHVDDNEPYTRLWCAYYLPGKDRQDASFVYHVACFEVDAELYSTNAVRLPDRGDGVRGAPHPIQGNKWDSWPTMGITPA